VEQRRTITTVIGRVETAGAHVETAVLHYKPGNNLFKQAGPTYYAAVTDAYIIYPWEFRSREAYRATAEHCAGCSGQ